MAVALPRVELGWTTRLYSPLVSWFRRWPNQRSAVSSGLGSATVSPMWTVTWGPNAAVSLGAGAAPPHASRTELAPTVAPVAIAMWMNLRRLRALDSDSQFNLLP